MIIAIAKKKKKNR